jgi:CheY-like chemotaxis protein
VSTIDILVVEDNPGDVDLLREGLESEGGGRRSRIHAVPNGAAAMAFLRRDGEYEEAPRPAMILLDLNLPMRSGESVLAEIKTDPDLRRIPVVVFTSSSSEVDISRSYELGANCYVTKPVDLARFEALIAAFEAFWLTMAKLPP